MCFKLLKKQSKKEKRKKKSNTSYKRNKRKRNKIKSSSRFERKKSSIKVLGNNGKLVSIPNPDRMKRPSTRLKNKSRKSKYPRKKRHFEKSSE